MFWACSAAMTCAAVRPWAVSLALSTITLICRGRAPMTSTCPTPDTVSRRRRRSLSTYSEMSRCEPGPETAMVTTGMAPGSKFCTIGGSASVGRSPRMVEILSRTSCVATSRSFSRLNEIMTTDTFSEENDVSSLMPLIVLTASSILSVSSVSISSGAAPGSTVVTMTNGNSTFGKRSTPSLRYENAPMTTSARMITVAKTGRRTQISASFCMGSIQFRFHACKQPRPQPSVAVRELRFREHGPRLRVDHAADGLDDAFELLVRIGIDGRGDAVAAVDAAEVALGDGEAELEGRELHDHEGHAAVAEAGADFGALLGHDAVDRRAQRRIGDLLAQQRGLGVRGLQRGAGLLERGLRAVERRAGNGVLRDQLLLAGQVA